MSKEEKVKFFKKQIELEKEIIEAAEKSVSDTNNIMIKELIHAIAIDSKKHASMLKALLTLNEEVTPFIPEKENEEIKKEIEHHIQLEKQAIETYKKLLEECEKERERMIIRAIYQDELRHHNLLKRIYKTIVESETIKEDELWDYLMEDAIPHY